MKIHTATAAVILDIRRNKADGTFPLKLRITFQRVRRYYNIGIDMLETKWAEVQDKSKTRQELRLLRERIAAFEAKAEGVLKTLEEFTFEAFERNYFQSESETLKEKAKRRDIASAFQIYIDKLKKDGQVSTASSYEGALASISQGYRSLSFEDITPEFLKKYEKSMLQKGRSLTTVGIYLRSVRAIMNQALDKSIITKEQYPFGKHRYQIPASRNIKKALTLAEVEKIFHFSAQPGSSEEKARDLWIFSYLCNGMNVKDICRLKWKNINEDSLQFIRAKTANTAKTKLKPIVVILSQPAQEIIDKWGTQERHQESFVFPFLESNVTPKRERDLVQNVTKFINKWMKRIANNLGIAKPVSSYYARHSFATVLKRSGAPTEFIAESLGHTDLKTTENYLDSFEDDVKRKYTKALLKFND
ncbi:site-specific integrase [Spirosoma radiotolerans]|uniref:Site-specific tyrosine recombinase XerD n=1 Tax=Spirosoma radiotolerans TaxID=1379870 RepID=A0A0E3V9A3_9BACT|nr:site-specific integrase [Spirosoma radiotolerans]AKD56976.1 site-specific tyrosine recombinase XerD [Spirosoma radiotolerans]